MVSKGHFPFATTHVFCWTWHGVLAIGRVEELHLLRLDEFLHQVDAWERG
jgi:hypothetical protein